MGETQKNAGAAMNPETLAAFLEGKLNESERREVMALLAHSSEAREALADAYAVLNDAGIPLDELPIRSEPPDDAPPPTSRAGPRVFSSRRRRLALAAAASIVLVTVVGIPSMRQQASLTTVAATALLPIGPNSPPPRVDPPMSWSRTRGSGPGSDRHHLSFRVGYRAVDLALAASIGNTQLAAIIAGEMEVELSEVELSGPSVALIRAIAALPDPTDTEQRRRLLSEADAELARTLDARWLELGRWTAAASVAAAGDDRAVADFFGNRTVRRALDHLGEGEWPTAVDDALAEVRRLAGGEVDPDPAELRRALANLASAGGG